jgi:hypothetical protein
MDGPRCKPSGKRGRALGGEWVKQRLCLCRRESGVATGDPEQATDGTRAESSDARTAKLTGRITPNCAARRICCCKKKGTNEASE